MKKLGYKEVRAAIMDIAERMHDSINPKGDQGGCVYEDGDGNHCIVGQLAYEMGWDIDPDFDSSCASEAGHSWLVTPEALQWLNAVQLQADAMISWGEINFIQADRDAGLEGSC